MTSDPSTTNDPPQLQRDLSQKAIAGVASGIAAHLRLPVVWFRAAFVLLAFFNGLGVFLYGVLWALVPAGEREEAPGLAGATRASMRPQRIDGRIDAGMLFSAGALIAGVLWGMIPGDDTDAGRGMSLFWPLLLAGVGVVLIWFQADGGGLRTRSPGKRAGTIASVVRLVGGLILVGSGTSWLLASQFGWDGLQTVVAAAVALLAGVAVVMAPWLLRIWSRVRTADRERLRAEARADMAAHLHDSVLQTLALIQRQADDPVLVASLARRQERELRTWLYGEETRAQTLKGALEQMRIDVEERFPIAVEVICVSDMDLDEASTALVQAAGEAVTNAAKHSGAPRVDVFAEVEPERVEVFVRDRGCGFDESTIRPDRRGVKESIMARMERHGGTARIRTAPGEGTEVRLELIR
ncbi:ATP-binding protein [[Pseudopropionibacterium] massiliense]|uniref:ATP-binding protein n=1 Tax=[Pseudopropionibacterium] massiliense TaxID=2220000 RepID=UPI001032327B|nr:ATP-binding protein [[Pseudopropionibacterium] massiliense]